MLATATRTDLTTQLWSRASRDANFKEALFSDANGVLEREFGYSIPSNKVVKVLQETEDTIYLVLPKGVTATAAPSVPEKAFEVVREPFSPTKSCGCSNQGTC